MAASHLIEFLSFGTGCTGSLVATTLAKHGVRNLSLIDPDVLESHNLDAMDAMTERDLGRFKAEAIAENLERDLPHVQITALPQSVMTAEARMLVKTADVLVCCVDDDAARLVTGTLACCYMKPLLDIGTGILRHSANPAEWESGGIGEWETARQAESASSPTHLVPPSPTHRVMGADVRLILPGDGCLLCWGGVANPQEALER